MRADRLLDAGEFLHELLIDMQPSGGVEDHKIIAVILRTHDRTARDFNRVALPHLKDRDSDLFPDHLKLFDGGGTVNVAGDQQRPFPLRFEVFGELCAMGGFSGALQPAHHQDGGQPVREAHPDIFTSHQGGHLVLDDLDDLLGGGQALENLGADRALGDGGDKILGDLIVDVGLEKRQAHLAHDLLDIRLLEFAPGLQALEYGV